MNAHIINCDEEDFFESFLPNGYLGVGIVVKGTKPQQLSRACRTSYSMYADMKPIRPGDIIFVHAGQKIYGAFKAETEFLEDPKAPKPFLSENIHYYPKPNDPKSGWKNLKKIPTVDYYRQIAIKHFIDGQGRNLCFCDGVDANEVFELKLLKKVWSIPERWKYTDAARTVRPLMEDEALELIKIIERENADSNKRREVEPANLTNFIPIQFNLNPNIVEDEKIIEGWVLENLGKDQDLDKALGPLTSFGNNIPVGYLRFTDIFGYQEMSFSNKIYKVIEVKKDDCLFPNDINQLLGYINWVVDNIALGYYKAVEGTIIAKDFNDDSISFVKNSIALGRKIRLIKFSYDPPSYEKLKINRVI